MSESGTLVTVANPRRRRTPPRGKGGRFKKRGSAAGTKRRRRRNPSGYVLTNPRRKRRRRSYSRSARRSSRPRRSNPLGLGALSGLVVDGGLALAGYTGANLVTNRFLPGWGGWQRVLGKVGVALAASMFLGKVIGSSNARKIAVGASIAAVQDGATMLGVPFLGGGGEVSGYYAGDPYARPSAPPEAFLPSLPAATRAGILEPSL